MPHPQFPRRSLCIRSVAERPNKVRIERDAIEPATPPHALSARAEATIAECVERIRAARRRGRAVILAFGAHTIKNGLSPVLIRLMEQGWLTHLATNGAGIIHDWEFAFQGQSSEDVRANVARGQFGIWEETGHSINLALVAGAWRGMGYGEAVGAFIEQEGVKIPSLDELEGQCRSLITTEPERAAAAADFLGWLRENPLPPGFYSVRHPYRRYSVQAAAFRLNIPFTGHPMIGHDIIYCHPANHGAAIGRAALRDFLAYARSVQDLEGGVYLSIGSAVMSPMIFEKSLSMAQNLRLQTGTAMTRHFIAVVDLAESRWDWQKDGEPPADNPAYYLRYCKTFSRMGGEMRYISADNRDFLLTLAQRLAPSASGSAPAPPAGPASASTPLR